MQCITPFCFFFVCQVVCGVSLQMADEANNGLDSPRAIVAYALMVFALAPLCIVAVWKLLRRQDRLPSGNDEQPAASSVPQTPTLLQSRQASKARSFNEKGEDLESGKAHSREGLFNECRDSTEVDLDGLQEVDLDDLSNAGVLEHRGSKEMDLDELAAEQSEDIHTAGVVLTFPADDDFTAAV
mmetsp:Transcript_94588/g.173246  ORF Transcript_94588/g.173246 Transcript_94588/m.173246 type:complete len:184 (-) Transcript_94588:10-561(-)